MYKHTQFGGTIALAMGAASVLVITTGAASGILAWMLPFVALMGLVFVLFGSLTTEIDRNELRCYFGPGLIRRRFDLGEIESVEPVRNRWWYGWGVRLTPHGWMFNVSGLKAVELLLRSGKRFRIGTDRPDELARRLREAAAMAGGSPAGQA